jgi:hypothetical protein
MFNEAIRIGRKESYSLSSASRIDAQSLNILQFSKLKIRQVILIFFLTMYKI